MGFGVNVSAGTTGIYPETASSTAIERGDRLQNPTKENPADLLFAVPSPTPTHAEHLHCIVLGLLRLGYR